MKLTDIILKAYLETKVSIKMSVSRLWKRIKTKAIEIWAIVKKKAKEAWEEIKTKILLVEITRFEKWATTLWTKAEKALDILNKDIAVDIQANDASNIDYPDVPLDDQ